MSKIQTRKSVSISGATYTRFKAYCRKRDETMSGVVEDLLIQLLNPNQPLVSEQDLEAKAERAAERELHKPESKLHKGAEPPKMDDVTKAVRKVQDIFTF